MAGKLSVRPVRMPLSEVQAKASERPAGYLEDVLSRGCVKNDIIEMDYKSYMDLIEKYEPQNLAVTEAELLKMPPVATQIKNAADALAKVTSSVTRGNPIVAPEEEIERRRAICESCEFLKGHRCAKCGCVFNHKIRLATQRCPMGRWLPC